MLNGGRYVMRNSKTDAWRPAEGGVLWTRRLTSSWKKRNAGN